MKLILIKNRKTRLWLSLAANAMIVLGTVIGVVGFFTGGGDGNMAVEGVTGFRYYTTDSNILASLASAAMIICQIRRLKNGSELPQWAIDVKFIGTELVMITFLVVVCFLTPIVGYGGMFDGGNLYMHLTSPLLSLFSLLLWETEPDKVVSRGTCLLSLVPTAAYAALYFTMVVVLGKDNGGWPDFYHYNSGGHWYFSVIIMGIGAWLLASLLRLLQKKTAK